MLLRIKISSNLYGSAKDKDKYKIYNSTERMTSSTNVKSIIYRLV